MSKIKEQAVSAALAQIDKALAVMERVPSVDMEDWQSNTRWGTPPETLVRSEADMIEANHVCGNTACFAGWIAISPEFQADGGSVAAGGAPVLPVVSSTFLHAGWEAISAWLGIYSPDGRAFVEKLVHGQLKVESNSDGYRRYTNYSNFYNKPWAEVDKEDVLMKLRVLREHVEAGTISV